MKSILITGGAGYVGSKISFDLTDKGYSVFIIDNLSTGSRKNINPRAKFYKLDISKKKKIYSILKKNNIKIIIHCAASISVTESMLKKKKYYKNNVIGTKTLLEASKNLIDYFIFSSTCAIYDTSKAIVNENTKILPKNYYGKTKYLCEKLIKEYSKKHNFKYAILRFFNVAGTEDKLRCGSRNNIGQLIKNLAVNTVKKRYEVNIYGSNFQTRDGTGVRDFIHINDISIFIIKIMFFLKKNNSLILNLGYGLGFSVLEVVKTFEKITKKKFKKNYDDPRSGEISSILADTKKLRKIIQFNRSRNILKKIVKTSIDWEKKINGKKI